MIRLLLFCLVLLLAFPLAAQKKLNKYRVEFTDKKDSPYSVFKPYEFLSPRAIERRRKHHVAIKTEDLPVNPQYLDEIKAAGGEVLNVSKWFNSAIVYAPNEEIEIIKNFTFVKKITPVGKYKPIKNKGPIERKRQPGIPYERSSEYYGKAAVQIKMLNGHYLHTMGYKGEGVLVSVLDGGFTYVDIMPFFDSLRVHGRLLESRDFVYNDHYAYQASFHGTNVLSTMGANLPGLMVGTAPEASYVCISTEETGNELIVEEDNWVAGIEYADSLGADISNSSLGYTVFDRASMNHSYEDMTGDVSRASRAADIAASKGMLLVNSAGNSGRDAWRYIGAPADADSVLAIGAVDRFGMKASFSSFGPSADGDIKPNVAAMGARAIVADPSSYGVKTTNGTSFSSPILAGMAASLWQAFPEKTNMEIFRAIEQSGSQSDAPDDELGYGIPDFLGAFLRLSESVAIRESASFVRHEPLVTDELILVYATGNAAETLSDFTVYNVLGEKVLEWQEKASGGTVNKTVISDISTFPSGVYLLEYQADTELRCRVIFRKL